MFTEEQNPAVCPQEEEEFWTLAVGLGLLAPGPQAPSSIPSASCLEWPAVSAFQLVTQWCEEVKGLPEMHTENSLVGDTTEIRRNILNHLQHIGETKC